MIQLVVEGFSEENRVRVSDRHAIYALVRSSTGGRRDIEVLFDDNSDRTLITISSVGNTLSEENKKTIHQKLTTAFVLKPEQVVFT